MNDRPNLDRIRRQVMSNQEADEVARYIEAMEDQIDKLCAYVEEAAGDESCLLPASTLALMSKERVELGRVVEAARDLEAHLEQMILRKAQRAALEPYRVALRAALPPEAGQE